MPPRSSVSTGGGDGFRVCQGGKVIALKVWRSAVKNSAEEESSAKMCWLWASKRSTNKVKASVCVCVWLVAGGGLRWCYPLICVAGISDRVSEIVVSNGWKETSGRGRIPEARRRVKFSIVGNSWVSLVSNSLRGGRKNFQEVKESCFQPKAVLGRNTKVLVRFSPSVCTKKSVLGEIFKVLKF